MNDEHTVPPEHVNVALAMLRRHEPLNKPALRAALKPHGVDFISNDRLHAIIREARDQHHVEVNPGTSAATGSRCPFEQAALEGVSKQFAGLRRNLRSTADQRESDAVADMRDELNQANGAADELTENVRQLKAQNEALKAQVTDRDGQIVQLNAALSAASDHSDELKALRAKLSDTERLDARVAKLEAQSTRAAAAKTRLSSTPPTGRKPAAGSRSAKVPSARRTRAR